MKFRKLLAGAAVAALTAGTASALDLTLTDNGDGGTTSIGLANEGNNLPASDDSRSGILKQWCHAQHSC